MQLAFEKFEGLGNDFIVCRVDAPEEFERAAAVRLCDRHFGIGADGVLLVSSTQDGRARMTVINADGSQPEMCGNGLRCAALLLTAEATPRDVFVVDTDAGPRKCEVERLPAGGALVTTELGRGVPAGSLEHVLSTGSATFARISMGNPHAVCFGEQLSGEELDRVGPVLSARVPGGTNVEVATLLADGSILLQVWERGAGRTLACGTGAAATAVAAVRAGFAAVNVPLQVHLPGGALELRVDADLQVTLKGPARRVFTGVVSLPERAEK